MNSPRRKPRAKLITACGCYQYIHQDCLHQIRIKVPMATNNAVKLSGETIVDEVGIFQVREFEYRRRAVCRRYITNEYYEIV